MKLKCMLDVTKSGQSAAGGCTCADNIRRALISADVAARHGTMHKRQQENKVESTAARWCMKSPLDYCCTAQTQNTHEI